MTRLVLSLALLTLAPPFTGPLPAEVIDPRISTPPLTLTIRSYAIREHDELSAASVRLATALLHEAGLASRWTSCGPTHVDVTCALPLGATELAMRLVHDHGPQPRQDRQTMGASLVDARTRTGALATIYLDRIDRLASATGTSAEVLVARAIAHEAGHLVLGTSEHGATGLMRPVWSQDMLRHEPASDWVFTTEEGRRLRQALAERSVRP